MKKNIFHKAKRHLVVMFFRIFSVVLLFGSLYSCDLQEKPYTQFDSENYYTDVNKLNLAVLNVYSSLQHRSTYGETMWVGFDSDTDLSHFTGAGAGTGNRGIAHATFDATFGEFDAFWKLMYKGINLANEVLDNVDNVPVADAKESAQRSKFKAETKFLRAIYYFDLVRYFGDVPLTLKPSLLGDNFKLPRTSKDTVYAQIVQDLEEAIPDLPDNDKVEANGRVTKSSAMGMLARVQLFRGGYSLYQDGQRRRPDNYKDYYQEVLNWTQLIINSGKHRLNPSYEQIFKDQCTYAIDVKENLFEIDLCYKPGLISNGMVGVTNTPPTAKGVYATSSTWVKTQAFAYLKFDSLDLRRNVTIAPFSVNAAGAEVKILPVRSFDWNPGKWRRSYQNSDQFIHQAWTSINFVLLRYSDVLLMRAEALNEINEGPTAEAYELVNQVRRRGYGKPIGTAAPTVDMPTGLTKQQFLEYIQDERARELMFEGVIRRHDLIRWNILGAKIREMSDFLTAKQVLYGKYNYTAATTFIDGKNELFPIPIRELRENTNLVQNPGYNN